MPYRIRTTLCGTAPLVYPYPAVNFESETTKKPSNNSSSYTTENAYELDKPMRIVRDCKGHVIWAGPLQDRFIFALHLLGSDAVPSTILDVMNVPELTRENVGSHLQKYKKQKRARKVRIHPPLTRINRKPPEPDVRNSVNKVV